MGVRAMNLDTNSEASLATLITFSSGAGFATQARYTSCTNPIIAEDGTFLPEPSIEVTMNAQGGGANDTPVQVRMLVRAPLDALTSQRAHSAVRVKIEEVDPTDLATRRTLFAGVIRTSTRNPDGKTGIVQFEVAGWRAWLEIPANNWLADTSCNNTLGDVVCGANLAAAREAATVTAIDGNRVMLAGLATTAVDGYWRFGYLALDGLQIMVRDYTTGDEMTLLKTPPASWVGQVITATPGCDKQLGTCRNRWNREARFTGFGLRIPAYNPLLESN
jgi:hypothetical protein